MTAFFLLVSNIGSVLSLLQGLDWLKKQGHTDKPVSQQLAEMTPSKTPPAIAPKN
jgi:hypothetical protein